MNTTELIALVRQQALLETSNVDYTDTVILRELNNALTTKFERLVLDAKSNYWLQYQDYTLVAGQPYYRLPARALLLSKVEIGNSSAASTTGFVRLPEITENRVNVFQAPPSTQDQPRFFLLRGDKIFLTPSPNSGLTMRVWYYIRPSRLTPIQATTTAGFVTTVTPSPTTPTVAVIASIVSYNDGGSTTPLTGTGSVGIDIVPGPTGGLNGFSTGSAGWRDLFNPNTTTAFNAAGTLFTFPAGTDLSLVSAGDYVRAAEQSEWPPLPEDFHRTLADLASAKILIQRDFIGKAQGYLQDSASDLARFAMLISDRVQEEAIPHRAVLPSLRMGRFLSGG